MVIGIEKFLSINKKLVIDMRTKEEYDAGHIIESINFEILNYEERKKVSILYNDGLNKKAYLLAYEYALDKLPRLFNIIKKYKDQPIVFYCARGGSRSTIVYEVFKNLKAIEIYKLKDGYKSYRQFVNAFFDTALEGYESLTIYENVGVELSGEFLNNNHYLLVDLRNKLKSVENPFRLLNSKEEYLNNKMLNYLVFEKLYHSNLKKIVFILPIIKSVSEIFHEALSQLIDSGKGIYLSKILEDRVKSIKDSYLKDDFTLDLIVDFFESKRKKMSNALVDEIIDSLKNAEFSKGIELILLNYCNPMMDYFTENNEIIKMNSIKEINKYLENWSE